MGEAGKASRTVPAPIADRVAEVWEAESRRVLATLVRLLGDLDLAEEALQEAFHAALKVWAREGVPTNPRAWLISTGRFKGIDAMRRRQRHRELAEGRDGGGAKSHVEPVEWTGDGVEDDRLGLIFTCCHPLLSIDGRICLSLRAMCGLSTEEIARAFFVSRETMKRRITRAKATLRNHGVTYEVPTPEELAERLDAVLHVVYLVYNEGYSATTGAHHVRRDLTTEAVGLARLIADMLPEPEALGLLALLLLQESRSDTRTDIDGTPLPLGEQDRSRWDRGLIAEGEQILRKSVETGRLGSYAIQAAIASVHASAVSGEDTKWDLIVGYYDMLTRLQDSPVVALNRAIAVGMRDGPLRGLETIDALLKTEVMAGHHRAHAARAEFARRAGVLDEAGASYRRALELVRQEPERRFLQSRLDALGV